MATIADAEVTLFNLEATHQTAIDKYQQLLEKKADAEDTRVEARMNFERQCEDAAEITDTDTPKMDLYTSAKSYMDDAWNEFVSACAECDNIDSRLKDAEPDYINAENDIGCARAKLEALRNVEEAEGKLEAAKSQLETLENRAKKAKTDTE